MGVTNLWTVVAPTARPTHLASLNRKRLAVDASIWIYQFLKAVRDKEGNALRNSHVVGFFRRICKLLYFGIKPVFVFDGGAPVLKRETVRKRVARREGRREDAARTAGKLLAVQVARAAEEEERRRKDTHVREEEEEVGEGEELVYVEEIGMSKVERTQGRGEKFKKKDQYHLPDLDVSIGEMGAPNDPRIMSQGELEEYARQFHSGEDINLYDFSKIDFESPFFMSLPPGDRYNILNAARLRSRLRMGYSKEQLDGMFPDRMAFSKFQIERVRERNELTQRLMHINGMADGDFLLDGGGRIAGEKGKEYILVKNEGVEGGWALGVVSNKQGTEKGNAIDLDRDDDEDVDVKNGESADEEDFEDVAIEGLNRLPKNWTRKRKAEALDADVNFETAADIIAKKRKAVYDARRAATDAQNQAPALRPALRRRSPGPAMNDDSLFVPADEDEDELFEDVLPAEHTVEEEDDLQRAIAMSLEQPIDEPKTLDDPTTSGGFLADDGSKDSDQDESFDLQAALAESRKTKPKSRTNVRDKNPLGSSQPAPTFGGPLPFESINLGQSLLGKKKSKKIELDMSGGFDRELGDDAFRKERPPQPMPDWFNATPNPQDLRNSGVDRAEDDDHATYGREDVDRREILRRQRTREVIDVDAKEDSRSSPMPVELEPDARNLTRKGPFDQSDDDHVEEEVEVLEQIPKALDDESAFPSQSEVLNSSEIQEVDDPEKQKRDREREERYELARAIAAESGAGEPEDQPQPTLGEVAERVQAEPPPPSAVPDFVPAKPTTADILALEEAVQEARAESDEEVQWSESDNEQPSPGSLGTVDSPKPQTHPPIAEQDEDEGEDFEDVNIQPTTQPSTTVAAPNSAPPPLPTAPTLPEEAEYDYLSSDEEDLMRQLAEEAEEHARFTSSLQASSMSTSGPTTESARRDFESELKTLRNQQKKDRRDADEVTQTMILECQALLRLFGLPYITAPMEAEAQCAELVHLGLVDGIVTDDSDIFLFGGTRIYKNMFNAAKYVECYLSSDLEKEFLLDRRKLVRFAHLLGSDYTEGIPGVGPVTALEILTDFDDLETFKSWCEKVQLGRPADLEAQLTTPFRRKFRKTVQKKLFLPANFPDLRVDEAYLKPEVDSNKEEFQWGVPDLDKLRTFLMQTIGWGNERVDEVLVPVVRDINRREVEGTQSNITRYFSGSVGVGASGGGLNGVRGGGAGKLAMGGEAPGQGLAEGMAPRNRTGKESGRMRNAFKRLRGEAEKKRRMGVDGEDEDGEDVVEGLGDIQDISADEGEDGDSATKEKTPVDGDQVDDDHVSGDEAPSASTKAKSTGKAKTAKSKKKAPPKKNPTTRRKRRQPTADDTDDDDV